MRDARSNAAPRLDRVGDLMREATPVASRKQHLEGRARLIASVEGMRRPSWGRVFAGGLAAAAVLGALLLVLMRRHAPGPIAWHVENGVAGDNGYVSIAPTAPSARIAFEDGSRVELAPGSRGRVAATTPVGAEVVLEQGRARIHVEHRERTRWSVDAGPFAVQVTGTEFTLAWAADAGVLDLWMRSGRVVVTGPVIAESVALSGGQHLAAHLHEATVQIDAAPESAEAPTTAPSNPPPAATTSTSEDDAPSAPSSTAGAQAVGAGPSWPRLVATGDYARVVQQAQADGVDRDVAQRPLADLRALGDAARYTGSSGVARRAYSAIRSRFSGSGEARTAAFLIGRVAEEQDRSLTEALRWYDVYLAEAPGGAFAGDALGRKMVLISRVQGRDSARPLAQRYLQRFPAGPYAAAAKDLAP
jgi:hypothetical protein